MSLLAMSCMDKQHGDKPRGIKINENVAIKPAKVEIEVYEGHLHTHCNPKGDVFWAKSDGGFHANPVSAEDVFPLKRKQVMVYKLQNDGTYKREGEDAIRGIATHEDGTEGGGAQYALILKLYDKEGNRIDQDLRKQTISDRVQVFYIPKNADRLRDTTTLFNPGNKFEYKDIFYYWYFDRETDNIDLSPKIMRNPVGFRGVFILQTGWTKFDVDILVTILPEGKKKSAMKNSVSPDKEQLDNIAFILTVPFRSVSMDVTPKLPEGMDYDDFFKLQEQEIQRKYKDISDEFGMSLQEVKDADDKRGLLNPESSVFWL